jgi:3-keto-disaccharide hydrolase
MRLLPAALAAATLSVLAFAQQTQTPPPDAPPSGPGRGGRGGGFTQPAPSDWNDHDGWKPIFDGRTLENWHCDPDIWKVEDGMLVARSTVEKPVGTTYCTWMGGEPADFELKAEIRMLLGGNSGIQYRSVPPPARPDAGRGGPGGGGRFGAGGGTPPASPPVATPLLPVQPCQMQIPVLLPPAGRGGPGRGGAGRGGAGGAGRGPNPYNIGGYQYDWEFAMQYPGNLYENGVPPGAPEGTSNRGIITYKGQVVHLLPDARKETIGCTGDATDLRGVMNINGWNYIHIIARGPVLIHMLNGRLMTLTIDDDPVRRKMSGRIAPQLEGIGEVYFRNLWLKTY